MQNFSKCPNCGGEEYFNPETGMLVCERCGGTFPVNEPSTQPTKREYTPTFQPNNVESNQYECATCGAKIVVGSNGEVHRCASCGNRTVKKSDTTLTSTPDGIIPFCITKSRAAELFRNWVSTRKFAPSDLKQMAKLEKLSGLYVPVWNFNFDITWRYSAIGVKKYTDDDGYSEYRDCPVDKVKDASFSNVLRAGSSKVSWRLVEDIGNYDFSKVRPYSTDYLLGFAGLDTDIDVHSVYDKITSDIISDNERVAKNRLEGEYFEVNNFNCRTRFRNVIFNYTYVPVWANHYTYKGKRYHCYINGQTGKTGGSAPKSFWKIGGLTLGILGALAAIVGLVFWLI